MFENNTFCILSNTYICIINILFLSHNITKLLNYFIYLKLNTILMPYIMLINDSPNFTLININYNLAKATAINHLITKK